jgi:FtsP/CotA-like multicopper oxidase with cupredoxin domain
MPVDRRDFFRLSSLALFAGAGLATETTAGCARTPSSTPPGGKPDHTVRIGAGTVELAPNRVVSTTLYNGQFPGPLLRFREGQTTWVDIYNDTDTPEQLHWHGQRVPVDVDGAAEEGTPYIPAHGMRRITFTPGPAGFRFYHTHLVPRADLSRGQYGGQVGPVYIEPRHNPGAYDQEIFLTLKEFEPTFSTEGDMPSDFLAGEEDPGLKEKGESAMAASLAQGTPHGYEVGYGALAINGRMLGHGEPIRVQPGHRVLLHVLNGSAGENRSLALPGHTFTVIALDGNPVPTPQTVDSLMLAPAERIDAVVEMNAPGVWIFGSTEDEVRAKGMGVVVEYAGATGEPQWKSPAMTMWDYLVFGNQAVAPEPDAKLDLLIQKITGGHGGFNRWTLNGKSWPDADPLMVEKGKRYRLVFRNDTGDMHPMHLHRHSFTLTNFAGKATAGIVKDVVNVPRRQTVEVDFVADNPGPSLLHCHMQEHQDFGFMTLLKYT